MLLFEHMPETIHILFARIFLVGVISLIIITPFLEIMSDKVGAIFLFTLATLLGIPTVYFTLFAVLAGLEWAIIDPFIN